MWVMAADCWTLSNLHFNKRFKKCKAVGMTYRELSTENIEFDTLSRELFEIRQKQLQETTSQNFKEKSVTLEGAVKKSTKLELKSSLFNRMRKKKCIKSCSESDSSEVLSKECDTDPGVANFLRSSHDYFTENQISAGVQSVQISDEKEEHHKGEIYMDYINLDCKVYSDMRHSYSGVEARIQAIHPNPKIRFTLEEKERVDHLLKLDQSIVISFNDLEHDVAVKVRRFR